MSYFSQITIPGVSTEAKQDTEIAILEQIRDGSSGPSPEPPQQWKSAEPSAQQTGTMIWTPASGKKIAVESLVISSDGSDPVVVTLWFAVDGDTAYTPGTDQPVVRVRFGKAAGPFVFTPAKPVKGAANAILRLTTSAAVLMSIQVFGHEE